MVQIKFIRNGGWLSGLLGMALLAGCASPPPTTVSPANAEFDLSATAGSKAPDVLLLGEQHDAAAHQQWQQATVARWAAQQQLAAVVLEMADAGHSTQGLAPSASEAQVQQALAWNDKGWPWRHYGPAVMTAVQAGVPVLGGNLPRAQMREVMQQTRWDSHLPATAWQRQLDAIADGHCGLLPASQLAPMARIQLAKDESMAKTAASQLQQGKTVLLIAGRGHVLRSIGIPTWLPAGTRSVVAIGQAGDQAQADATDRDWVHSTPALPAQDHCAALREKWKK
ncbi:ChaN family lipoprotein [Comamonas piscis]|uniref:ChaN family lipoprotein n=1 Tax=Comamonas piscis TaxID=1562974 RepID=A0A7G5ENE7_9BURK|nr:ChaN family lipoprotein [Comamonas piscis]